MSIQLPKGFGSLDFSGWAYGLLAAFIGGGAGAFAGGMAAILVDPNDFNIYTAKFWELVSTTFVIAGLAPFFAYLHQQPLPDLKKVETTTQTTDTGKGPATVTTTVKETTMEPKESAK